MDKYNKKMILHITYNNKIIQQRQNCIMSKVSSSSHKENQQKPNNSLKYFQRLKQNSKKKIKIMKVAFKNYLKK